MASSSTTVHLPNGQHLTVNPVFGGFFFKLNDLSVHSSVFPAGWTVILQTEDDSAPSSPGDGQVELAGAPKEKHRHIQPFKLPTLGSDYLFISSISNPSSSDFTAPVSPTRQIAMMLWATLYWYFHLPEPSPYVNSEASKNTPEQGRPRGEWRINVRREGVLRGRNLIQKLERMCLVTSEDSSVGLDPAENAAEGWSEMFTARRTFWQLSARLFLFTLPAVGGHGSIGSPNGSRPGSPNPAPSGSSSPSKDELADVSGLTSPLWSPAPGGPFSSGSHLPTYYPPPPLQHTLTNGVLHPRRPKPPRQGETFYTRFVPSEGKYLSFRVASLSPRPVPYSGPSSSPNTHRHHAASSSLPAHFSPMSIAEPIIPTPASKSTDLSLMTDLELLSRWMNDPRVSKFWGCSGPKSVQEEFLRSNLSAAHSFPAIGMWDGKPFGYFEIYWVKEDTLGKLLGNGASDFDRGFHVLVGEDEWRGKNRVLCWSTAIAHWAFVQDYRTQCVVLEPRVDNVRFISHLGEAGFLKEREITFPHKQSAFVKLRRENFEGPVL